MVNHPNRRKPEAERIMTYGLQDAVTATVVIDGEPREVDATVIARSAAIAIPNAIEHYDLMDADKRIHRGITVNALRGR